jgi:predicted RNA binding protein YcfA (HicA-like mRNA interferase family)
MPKLPRVKPKVAIRALKKAGFYVDHVSGSHYILYKDDKIPPISIPYHNKDLKIGTLSNIIKQAKLSKKDFIDLL